MSRANQSVARNRFVRRGYVNGLADSIVPLFLDDFEPGGVSLWTTSVS